MNEHSIICSCNDCITGYKQTSIKTICKKCSGEMKPSKAIVCRATGKSDFIGHGEAITMSPDPKQPVFVDCSKCVSCGWSVSEGVIA